MLVCCIAAAGRLAGLLLGVCAGPSMFVALVALLVIAQTSWPDRRRIARRVLLMAAALALACLPTFLWVRARQGMGRRAAEAYDAAAGGWLPDSVRDAAVIIFGSLPVASNLALRASRWWKTW